MKILGRHPLVFLLMTLLGLALNTVTAAVLIYLSNFLGVKIPLTLDNAVIGAIIISTLNLYINIKRYNNE